MYLADQKLPVEVPRVRNVASATEVPLRAYQALQRPRQMDEGLLLRMLKGIATRNYEACAETVPEAFGLSRSSGSRRYVKGTARKLAQFQERSLEGYDLVERGLQFEAGLLVVMDGAKGLYKAVMSVLKGHACVQRCPYHKRQNVASYLPKSEHSGIRRKMEAAYGNPTYAEAKAALEALKPGLELMNQSALHSLEEGLEETLTLHRLGLIPMLKASFRTPNCTENVNRLLGQLTHNVRRWTNSSQRHRWVATALLDIEPRLRRVKGYRHLPMLRQAIQAELGIKQLAMTG